MSRKFAGTVAALLAALVLLPAPAAEACSRCRIVLVCVVDECEFVEVCGSPQEFQSSRVGCQITPWGCDLSGDWCSWS